MINNKFNIVVGDALQFEEICNMLIKMGYSWYDDINKDNLFNLINETIGKGYYVFIKNYNNVNDDISDKLYYDTYYHGKNIYNYKNKISGPVYKHKDFLKIYYLRYEQRISSIDLSFIKNDTLN